MLRLDVVIVRGGREELAEMRKQTDAMMRIATALESLAATLAGDAGGGVEFKIGPVREQKIPPK